MNYELHEMDCRLAMSMLMDADSMDSIVCDPPYGLSKEPDMAEVLRHWLAGDDYTHGGSGFMGKTWDSFVPGPSVWREAYRVLKPGGYLIAFFGTRTYDLGTLAIRLAGFEIRDQLAWVFGSGFPKSLDVSKAIDKMDAVEVRRDRALRFTAWIRSVGLSSALIDELTATNMGGHYTTAASQPAVATRAHFEKMRPIFGDAPDWVEELVNERTVDSENYAAREITGERTTGRGTGQGSTRVISDSGNYDLTSAHTDAAKQWQGWGTALKPAYEPIVLARKPLSERTVAANVLRHGTGAINVDGCRVATDETIVATRNIALGSSSGGVYSAATVPGVYTQQPGGRWPANLCHDGTDEVLAGFPVTTSGKMRAGTIRAAQDEPGSVVYGTYGGNATDTDTIGDSGSAARFFKTCGYDEEDLCALANIADMTFDLQNQLDAFAVSHAATEGFPAGSLLKFIPIQHSTNVTLTELNQIVSWLTMAIQLSGNALLLAQPLERLFLSLNPVRFAALRMPTVITLTMDNLSLSSGFAESVTFDITLPNLAAGEPDLEPSSARLKYCAKASKADRSDGNTHPTVKPTDLMRWLCRLVTPPGGTVFDPFTGSGSTGKAALLEGFQFVGCEMTPEYAAIARARLDAASVRGG